MHSHQFLDIFSNWLAYRCPGTSQWHASKFSGSFNIQVEDANLNSVWEITRRKKTLLIPSSLYDSCITLEVFKSNQNMAPNLIINLKLLSSPKQGIQISGLILLS